MKTGLQVIAVNSFFLLALGAETVADWLASLPAFQAACSAIAGEAASLVEMMAR
jgi:hypothetical protein